jgi:hypothetical protein
MRGEPASRFGVATQAGPKENIFSERLGPDGGAGPRTSPGTRRLSRPGELAPSSNNLHSHYRARPERLTISACTSVQARLRMQSNLEIWDG